MARFLRGSVWLFLDRFFRMGLGFSVGVLIARHYGPADFGALSYVITLGSLIGGFASLGFDEIVPRDLSAKDQGVTRPTIQKTSLLLRLGAEGVSYGGLIFLLHVENAGPLVTALGLIYGLYFIFQATDILEFRLRSEGRFGRIAGIRSGASLLSSGLKIFAVLMGAPLTAIAWAMLFEYGVICLAYLVIQARRGWWSRGRWSAEYARGLLHRSFFVMVSVFLGLLLVRLDALRVERFLGHEALGLYSAAARTSELLDSIGIVLSVLLIPEFARRRETPLPAARMAYAAGFILFALALPFLYLLKPFFGMLYGPAYREAVTLLPLLAFKSLFYLIGMIRAGLLVAARRTALLPLYALTGILVSWPLYDPFMESLGLQGAALASLIGLFAANLLVDLAVFRQNLLYMLTAPLALRDLVLRFQAEGEARRARKTP